MMANEIRIAVMLFGLSASAALAQDVAAGETSFRKCRAFYLWPSGFSFATTARD
jgi:hypothetical protein